jgi:hypothetical protein
VATDIGPQLDAIPCPVAPAPRATFFAGVMATLRRNSRTRSTESLSTVKRTPQLGTSAPSPSPSPGPTPTEPDSSSVGSGTASASSSPAPRRALPPATGNGLSAPALRGSADTPASWFNSTSGQPQQPSSAPHDGEPLAYVRLPSSSLPQPRLVDGVAYPLSCMCVRRCGATTEQTNRIPATGSTKSGYAARHATPRHATHSQSHMAGPYEEAVAHARGSCPLNTCCAVMAWNLPPKDLPRDVRSQVLATKIPFDELERHFDIVLNILYFNKKVRRSPRCSPLSSSSPHLSCGVCAGGAAPENATCRGAR